MTAPGHVAEPGVARAYAIAHLPGDGVGPEVTDVARDCVDAVAVTHGFVVEWRGYPLGAKHFLATGEVLPDTRSCSVPSAALRCRPGYWSAVCCCGSGPSLTCT